MVLLFYTISEVYTNIGMVSRIFAEDPHFTGFAVLAGRNIQGLFPLNTNTPSAMSRRGSISMISGAGSFAGQGIIERFPYR